MLEGLILSFSLGQSEKRWLNFQTLGLLILLLVIQSLCFT